ncbi:MAG: 30S ribosomal protein S8 [Bacteroidales bacterium]|nr:30S ribosomal protein S8 [Bacteroidales bacterium]
MANPIANYLTRIRNAIMANHRVVEIPASNLKKGITKILFEKGYILNYKFEDENGPQGTIKIALKYHQASKISAINKPGESKPSRTTKSTSNNHQLPRVLNGLGIAIISTSHGVMTDKEARKLNIGGEIICYVS